MKTVWHIGLDPRVPLSEYQAHMAVSNHAYDAETASWTMCIAHYEYVHSAWIDPYTGTVSDDRYALPIYTHEGPVALGSFCSPYSLRACVRWLARNQAVPPSLDAYASDYLQYVLGGKHNNERMFVVPPRTGKRTSKTTGESFHEAWCRIYQVLYTNKWTPHLGAPETADYEWMQHVRGRGSFSYCTTTGASNARAAAILQEWGKSPPGSVPNIGSILLAPEPHEYALMALRNCEKIAQQPSLVGEVFY